MPDEIPFVEKELSITAHNQNNLPTAPYTTFTDLQGNLKTLSKENQIKLKKSIIKYGIVFPAFIWEEKDVKYIIDAHQRIKTLQLLEEEGYTIPEVPYVLIEAKNKKEAAELLLQANSRYGTINEKSSFFEDFDINLDYINEIEIPELDIMLDSLDSTDIVEDEIPEVPEDPVTQVGDLWTCGKHKVLCGDCTKAADVERVMQGKKVEMLFTSPPYSDMRNYNDNINLKVDSLVGFIPLFSSVTNYLVINLGIQRKDYEIIEYWQEYISKAKESNYTFLSWNVWNKEEARSLSQHKAFFPLCHEWIFVFGHEVNELNKTIKCGTAGKKTTSAYIPNKINNQKNREDKKLYRDHIVGDYKKLGSVITTGVSMGIDHPATFPLVLPFEYIKAMTEENDNICDPFLGSGTTLIAADQLNRICYGIEIAPEYVDVILERYYKLTGNDPIRQDGKKWGELKSI